MLTGMKCLTDNQSFTISSADLFKAYCLNKDFRKAIDTGKFVYVEGHVCLDDEKYIIHSEGRVKLTQYALSHMDECCLAFDSTDGSTIFSARKD